MLPEPDELGGVLCEPRDLSRLHMRDAADQRDQFSADRLPVFLPDQRRQEVLFCRREGWRVGGAENHCGDGEQ